MAPTRTSRIPSEAGHEDHIGLVANGPVIYFTVVRHTAGHTQQIAYGRVAEDGALADLTNEIEAHIAVEIRRLACQLRGGVS